jgi:hypothetical protein
MKLDDLIDEMVKAADDWEAPTNREVLRFLIRLAQAIRDDDAANATEDFGFLDDRP